MVIRKYNVVIALCLIAAVGFILTPAIHAAPILYVPNQFSNTVSVINGSTYSLIKTIPVGNEPYGVTVSPDNKTVFITNLMGNSVSVINSDTNTVKKTIKVGIAPFGVVVSPDGRYAYVANAGSKKISVIDTSSYNVVSSITTGNTPHGVAIHPDGSKLYVTNYSDSSVSVINTSTRKIIKTISVGAAPHGIAVHPSGLKVYVANVFGDSLSVISTASNSVIKTLNTKKAPFFPAVDPTGKTVYVSNWGEYSVSLVDVSLSNVSGSIAVAPKPHGISFDSTGARAFVVNEESNTVSVIDTGTRTVIKTIPTGKTPIAFGNFVIDDSTIPMPKGANIFEPFRGIVNSVKDSNPKNAMPVGLGTLAGDRSTLSLSLGAYRFPSPVDVYLALSAPDIDPVNIYLFTKSGLKPISEGFIPLMKGIKDISGPVLPDIDGLILPTADYLFYLLVVPAGTPEVSLADNYYLWSTDLSVLRASDVADKAIKLLGSDDKAAVAILLAYDNGYSFDQIVDAIFHGGLTFFGEIPWVSASAKSPNTSAPINIIMGKKRLIDFCPEPNDQEACAQYLTNKLQNFTSRAGIYAFAVKMLVDIGYSPEQIKNCLIEHFTHVGSCRIKVSKGVRLEECPDYEKDCSKVNPEIPDHPKKTTEVKAIPCTDNDSDDYCVENGDCRDDLRDVNPGMIENCYDKKDNDCDLKIDKADPGCANAPDCPDPAYPTACFGKCIPAGGTCCTSATYCPSGFTCFAEVNACCPGGMKPCPGSTEYCVIPGKEYQCAGSQNTQSLGSSNEYKDQCTENQKIHISDILSSQQCTN